MRTKEHKENTHSAAMVQWSHEDYRFAHKLYEVCRYLLHGLPVSGLLLS